MAGKVELVVKPTRIFLSVQPVGHRKPAGADPFTYRETRPVRYRASWWTRGTSTELYRGKPVATQEEAVRLARKWLERENAARAGGPADAQLIDTTDRPDRYGYAHEETIAHAKKKSARQLDAEIAEVLAPRAHIDISPVARVALRAIVDRYDQAVRAERDPEFARRVAEAGVEVPLSYATVFGLEKDGLITVLWPVGRGRRWVKPTSLGREEAARKSS